MNVSQLERIRKMIRGIRAELSTDPEGTVTICDSLSVLYEVVGAELQNKVWTRYLETEG